jgi:hypothetical protein
VRQWLTVVGALAAKRDASAEQLDDQRLLLVQPVEQFRLFSPERSF